MIEVRSSRRVPGPNLLWVRPGAVIDVSGPSEEVRRLTQAWRKQARRILDAVGWAEEDRIARVFRGGASLAISAPVDAVYAATFVNEWALDAARAEIDGERVPDPGEALPELWNEIARDANPDLLRLRAQAERRGVLFTFDPDRCSIGMGTGSKTFRVSRIPAADALDWTDVHDVPSALVTGTNGKSTTVRVVAAMIRAAGLVPGFNTTDGVRVGDDWLERGDYSGPEGSRRVVRDTRVEAAVLETARGGMLRRGLGVPRAGAVAVLNVAEDHLGEFGVDSLEDLVATKLMVRHAIVAGGHLVLNVDDPALAAWQARSETPVDAFTMDTGTVSQVAAGHYGGAGAWVEDDALVLAVEGEREVVARVEEVPMTLGGAAAYNVANALAALLLAVRLGLPATARRSGLLSFTSDARTNPGRTNVFEFGDLRVLVDYAHNPHGLRVLLETAAKIGGRRTLLLIGQAGDRDEDAIRELCRVAWAARPDRIVIKEMERLLRGREKGEIPAMMESALRDAGAGDDVIAHARTEMQSVRQALEWSRPGDLLLLLLHDDRRGVLRLMETLEEGAWEPGMPLPGR